MLALRLTRLACGKAVVPGPPECARMGEPLPELPGSCPSQARGPTGMLRDAARSSRPFGGGVSPSASSSKCWGRNMPPVEEPMQSSLAPIPEPAIARRISGRYRVGSIVLLLAGLGYVPGGILLILASWQATPGPYQIGLRYPFGGPLEAWQVTAGFAFVAYGIGFAGLVHAHSRTGSRLLWAVLAISFGVMWLPHLLIGLAFLAVDPTAGTLGPWKAYLPAILVWMAASAVGLIMTWTHR